VNRVGVANPVLFKIGKASFRHLHDDNLGSQRCNPLTKSFTHNIAGDFWILFTRHIQ